MKKTCAQCGGTGVEIDPQEMRKKRVARKRTLKQVADRMAISFGYLGDLERGRKPWNDFLKKLFLSSLK